MCDTHLSSFQIPRLVFSLFIFPPFPVSGPLSLFQMCLDIVLYDCTGPFMLGFLANPAPWPLPLVCLICTHPLDISCSAWSICSLSLAELPPIPLYTSMNYLTCFPPLQFWFLPHCVGPHPSPVGGFFTLLFFIISLTYMLAFVEP